MEQLRSPFPGAPSRAAARALDITTEGTNGVVWIRLRGELDVLTAPLLARALDDLRAPGRRLLVVDAAELRFVDRTGLATITTAAGDGADGTVIAVTACQRNVSRLFELTGHGDLISRARLLAAMEAHEDDGVTHDNGGGNTGRR
jgi:anti-anti-sigma factor